MRGSEWNKWNIHVHTKGTNKNDQFLSKDMDEFYYVFYKKALENNISAIAVTDYFSIDNYKIAVEYLKDISNRKDKNGSPLFTHQEVSKLSRIFIFPNVELRMMPSTDAGKLINIHCLFNPDYIKDLDNDFFNTIENQAGKKMNRAGLTDYGRTLLNEEASEKACYDMGVNNYVVEVTALKGILDKNINFRNNTIVIVSNSNKDGNSALQKHSDLFEGGPGALGGVRKTIYEISNAVFSSNPKDVSYFLGKRIDDKSNATEHQKREERKTVLRERGSFKACFVGCDAHTEADLFTKFTWVKGTLDFNGLKQILHEPEQRVKYQLSEPDQKEEKLIIDQVRFINADNLFTPIPIKFNKNLNVIIGGKSSGKSILLYSIAKTLLADRKMLKTGEDSGYKYDFGRDFDFEVSIVSGHIQSIKRDDLTPSILSEIKYIPQNYLSKLVEPENKKGNELVKLVRALLLEDQEYHSKYEAFKDRLKSNDIKRELAINSYFELQGKITEQKKSLIEKGDPSVIATNIATNNKKIEELKKSAGLTTEQLELYSGLSSENSDLEADIKRIGSDFTKVKNLTTDIRTLLADTVQKRNLIIGSLENVEIRDYYQSALNILDDAISAIEGLQNEIVTNENNQLINDNPFTRLVRPKIARSNEIKEKLIPFVEDQKIRIEIENLEKLVNEDIQKLNLIKQIALEIEKSERVLANEKDEMFKAYRENFDEYTKITTLLEGRTKLLENDRLQIVGTPKFNFPKFRNKIVSLTDSRKANFNKYPLLDERKTGISEFSIDQIVIDLVNVFNSMVIDKDYPFLSKVEVKSAVKNLLDDYFFDHWDVIYDQDKLRDMSSGKASFVVLMLIVGLSKSKAPILIDQPEDNLDNRSITKDLVEYLRSKKLERQIILVTHNANVVVNADAENVIVANQRGQNDKETSSPYQFDYVNGPIEHTMSVDTRITDLLKSMGIREHITDVVEGGEEAFKKRERKYGFSR